MANKGIISKGIVNVYVDLIRAGAKTLDEVPAQIRADVKKALKAVS